MAACVAGMNTGMPNEFETGGWEEAGSCEVVRAPCMVARSPRSPARKPSSPGWSRSCSASSQCTFAAHGVMTTGQLRDNYGREYPRGWYLHGA